MKILFIISGSVAISKCYEILKALKDKKIEVDIILTNNAKKLSDLRKLKQNVIGKIYTDKSETNEKMLHINLSRKNNLIVVCPATANTIAKFANGYADNLASTTLLASNKPIFFIPAMNSMMWENSINKKNIRYLKSIGIIFIGPKKGKLKCGEYGVGRIEDTKFILKHLLNEFKINKKFIGKKCLITAGPTIEKIDPIRFISNFSSGKQGYEIANQLSRLGAKVTLISGPTNLQAPTNVNLVKIQTADEMLFQVNNHNNKIDIAILCAAVADFKIKKISLEKIKKNNINKLQLIKNIDILKTISTLKKNRPKYIVGFAAETEDKINVREKLEKKNCDMIVHNQINENNIVFGKDENKISIITKKRSLHYGKNSKINCARFILNSIYEDTKV